MRRSNVMGRPRAMDFHLFLSSRKLSSLRGVRGNVDFQVEVEDERGSVMELMMR